MVCCVLLHFDSPESLHFTVLQHGYVWTRYPLFLMGIRYNYPSSLYVLFFPGEQTAEQGEAALLRAARPLSFRLAESRSRVIA